MFLGQTPQGSDISLDHNDLLTHGVVLGRTGSGKTGLTTALVEEAAQAGASVIVFDPKGDLTNMALTLTTPQEFAPWVDDGEAAYLRHGEKLSQNGLGFEHVEAWRAITDVSIFAPGKTSGGGRSVNVFPSFTPPAVVSTLAHDRAARGVGLILQAVANQNAQYDPAAVFMTQAVLSAWRAGQALPVGEWPGVLTKPGPDLQRFGGMKLEDFFPKRQRTKLARTLIGFHHQAHRWLVGSPLDLHGIVEAPKPQVCVFSMRHLNEEDRQFFAGLLMHRIVEFMFETGASDSLKLLIVLDEARGYLPPHPYNPPTKAPICTILAQGRAQGIGMVVGTQNPMDLDYKALSNVGTWFVGRLRERDCARDLTSELRNRGVEPEQVAELPLRRFMLLDKRGGHQDLKVRWCYNFLKGPLSGRELLRVEPEAAPVTRQPSFFRRKPKPEVKVKAKAVPQARSRPSAPSAPVVPKGKLLYYAVEEEEEVEDVGGVEAVVESLRKLAGNVFWTLMLFFAAFMVIALVKSYGG